jgi:CDP-6-deoxy-D-xylo-4-hexulose-3-dehydrase
LIKGRNIDLLEDCCESQGATVGGIKVGNFGHAGTFSFYWGHHMTTVEGGMVCTNDTNLYKILLLKRSHGLARELPEQYHEEIKSEYPDIDFKFLFLTDGFNFRNMEFNAVLGLSQLKNVDKIIKIRNNNYCRFYDMCKLHENELIVFSNPGISSFVLPFVFRKKERKLAFQQLIVDAGIECRPLVGGNLLRQPFLNKYYNQKEFSTADFIHDNAFYIGNNQFVNDKRLDMLEGLINKFFKK